MIEADQWQGCRTEQLDKRICLMINLFEYSAGFGGPIETISPDASDGFVPAEPRMQSNRGIRPELASFKPKAGNRISRSRAKFRCLFAPQQVLVTVCAWCDKGMRQGEDRNLEASWRPMELSGFESNDSLLTHGICPKCMHVLCNEKDLAVS